MKGVTAEDDKDGDVSGTVVVESLSAIGKDNTRTITYAVMDLSGNVGRATRTLQYTNYHQPRILLDHPLVVNNQNSVLEVLDSIRASSPLDGDLSARVKYSFPDGGFVNGDGDHPVVLRVSDSAGGQRVLPTIVEVCKDRDNVIDVELTEQVIYLNQGDKFDPYEYYEIASQSGRLLVEDDVDTAVPGVYHARYRVEDAATGAFGTAILVVVVEE